MTAHDHDGHDHGHHHHDDHDHEHHHHHDDGECDCGHDHEHGHHHHDDGEECDCGHHHEHSHEHGHHHHHDDGECDCGHDHHDHEHEHEAEDGISINHHEESTIAVFQKSIPRPYAEAVELLEGRMRIIGDAVAAKGGIIGHIKSVVIAEGDRCMLSITDAGTGPQRRDLGGESARFELVCIVFLVEDGDLRGIIRNAFREFFGEAGQPG